MLIFTAEFICCCFALDDYRFSFFFFLDFVSIATLIPDVGWLWILMIGEVQSSSSRATDIAKTTRASKLTRVIRIVRLIRIIRIVKLYK